MPISLVVLMYGLLAVAVITSVGRWCRAHPGPATPTELSGPRPGSPGDRPARPLQ